MSKRSLTPELDALVDRWIGDRAYEIKRELRAVKAVLLAAQRDHDPATREIAYEDHSHCPVCIALARLSRPAERKR